MNVLGRISRGLLVLGAGVCLLGVFGLVSGMFITFPSAAAGLLALSIPILTGGLLLVAGSVLGRAAKRRRELSADQGSARLHGAGFDED